MSALPHAFVVMPFGTKPGPDGQPIDFNRVYQELIAPSLQDAGLEPFRADQELRAGDILTDMFQELLIADLVVADLSIDNPNVWYELGVRHALRARGVVLICGGQISTAFDTYTNRKLRYGLKDGKPDPATLARDRHDLTEMVRVTMESWQGHKLSPVYQLMPQLQEPDWKSLRIGKVAEFWNKHEAWQARLDRARQAQQEGHIGDMLVLAEEAPVSAFRAEAWIKAGEALRRTEHFLFALEYLNKGLEIEPANLKGLGEKGMCIERLALAGAPGHSLESAREHYRKVLETYPGDPDICALLGRVDKDAWIAAWHRPGRTVGQMRTEARDEEALLRNAIDSYARAFRRNPAHYYSGINALTLMHLHGDLTGNARYEAERVIMAGAIRFAAECESSEGQRFWSKATLGDLEVLMGTPETVRRAYKEAVAKKEHDWFELNSCRAQLQWLLDLGFHQDRVGAGIAVFDHALDQLKPDEKDWKPNHVLLFSGHMVDAPGRKDPRFPDSKSAIAAKAIADELDSLDAGPQDMAFCQAAAGGDLLFLQACLQRGVRCQVLLPFPEAEFIARSISPSENGEKWTNQFYSVKENLKYPPRVMPDELGPLPAGLNPYERCNLWSLYSALSYGTDKVRFIALWNGGGGDGPGGTAFMINVVRRHTGRVIWLDTRKLW